MRCGRFFNDRFITCLLLSPVVKEFWKSVNMWRSYGQEYVVVFWLTEWLQTDGW